MDDFYAFLMITNVYVPLRISITLVYSFSGSVVQGGMDFASI